MFGFYARLFKITLVSLGGATLIVIYSRTASFSARTSVIILIVYAAISGVAAAFYEEAWRKKALRKLQEKEEKKADAADAYERICGKKTLRKSQEAEGENNKQTKQ